MSPSIGSPLLWGGFTVFILGMLALDLGVFHRRVHAVSAKEALAWSAMWIALSLVFNAGVYAYFGPVKGLEFLTGYLIEKALSVDNIFVFLLIFTYFAVPKAYQHRLLFWGVLGAIVMRVIFIVAGAALLNAFHWVIYIFGGFLVFTGIKILLQRNGESDPSKNLFLRVFRRLLPVTEDVKGFKLVVRRKGRWMVTPLMLVLLTVEGTDLVFAMDSIPAIFAVTSDAFIVFTSNIFAILGLRSLFFLLADVMDKFRYLKVGLGLVLAFVGAKMLISGFFEVPIGLSLLVIAGLLGVSIAASLLVRDRAKVA